VLQCTADAARGKTGFQAAEYDFLGGYKELLAPERIQTQLPSSMKRICLLAADAEQN